MRITPADKYHDMPCSYVGTGCAYEDIKHKAFNESLPDEIDDTGYLSLNNANRYLRKHLDIRMDTLYMLMVKITGRILIMRTTKWFVFGI